MATKIPKKRGMAMAKIRAAEDARPAKASTMCRTKTGVGASAMVKRL